MATARPVVVSRTEAIARGYGLVQGENCRLVPPGDAEALERALVGLLRDEAAAAAMGVRARERRAVALLGALRRRRLRRACRRRSARLRPMNARTLPHAAVTRASQAGRPVVLRLRTEADWLVSRRDRADVAVFHEFHAAAHGGAGRNSCGRSSASGSDGSSRSR